MHFLVWSEILTNLIIQILTIAQVEEGNHQWHNVVSHNLFVVVIETWGEDADFGHKHLCKPATEDTEERGHHHPNAAVWDENEPEQLLEQFQVRFSLEDEASVSKADQNGPECVAEKGRVQEHDVEEEVGDVEVLAPKNSVTDVLS